MDNKLNELTQKLYAEGLEKGRAESEQLIAQAREQAASIVKAAQSEAATTLANAQSEAEELHRNTMTELNLAGQQVVSKLKAAIREMAAGRAIGGAATQAALDPAFVREVLAAAVKNWREGVALTAMLPETMRGKLDEAFASSLSHSLEISFGGVPSGFSLAPRDGNYHIDFTDEAFTVLLKEYLRPKVDDIIFG